MWEESLRGIFTMRPIRDTRVCCRERPPPSQRGSRPGPPVDVGYRPDLGVILTVSRFRMGVSFLKLHMAVILAGFTGVFGKLVLLAEGPLVWWRMMLTFFLFAVYLAYRRELPRVDFRSLMALCGVGALLALHWLLFYGSIKHANVSIAVVCFASIGFFTAVFEPLSNERLPSLRELGFSLLSIAGIVLIFHFDTQFRVGIVLGVLCAAMGAVFTLAVKQVGKRFDSRTILLFQMLGGWLFLTLVAPAYLALFPGTVLIPSAMDFFYLFLLSSFCGIGLFILHIQSLQAVSAFTVNLTFNLEPVYSIALAMLFLGEAAELGPPFFAGLGLIGVSVLLQTLYTLHQTRGIRAREE